jgi:hypothetical protein
MIAPHTAIECPHCGSKVCKFWNDLQTTSFREEHPRRGTACLSRAHNEAGFKIAAAEIRAILAEHRLDQAAIVYEIGELCERLEGKDEG